MSTATLASHPAICFALVPASRAATGLQLRHSIPDHTFGDPAQDSGYAQLRLAVDVVNAVGGYFRILLADQFRGIVAIAAGGEPNRTATELLHRLGGPMNVVVYGAMVLHAAPDSRGYIGSLTDGQIGLLVAATTVVDTCIDDRQLVAA